MEGLQLTFFTQQDRKHGCLPLCDCLVEEALKISDASKVAPVDKLSLVLVAVFAFAFLSEWASLCEWLGIAVVAVALSYCPSSVDASGWAIP